MAADFQYDVFLSHSAKDKAVVRPLAERLRDDGLNVWFDEWVLKAGDSIPAKIEEGLEHSRVLLLCMSANAFGSDWAQLEAGTFRFRDPLNKERRFIPLRLDDAPIKGSLVQFLYIDWRPSEREKWYAKLIDACHSPVSASEVWEEADTIQWLDTDASCSAIAFSDDGALALFSTGESVVKLIDLGGGRLHRTLAGHKGRVISVAFSKDERFAVSGSEDHTIRLWELLTGRCLWVWGEEDETASLLLKATRFPTKEATVSTGHRNRVQTVRFASDGRRVISGSLDGTLRLWDVNSGSCLHLFDRDYLKRDRGFGAPDVSAARGHVEGINSVAMSSDATLVLSGSDDKTLRLWDTGTGHTVRVLQGHTQSVRTVALWGNGSLALSGSADATLRLWDVRDGRCLRIVEGHNGGVECVSFSKDGHWALTGSTDQTVRMWDARTWRCVRVLKGHEDKIVAVEFTADGQAALSADERGEVRRWSLSALLANGRAETTANQLPYTNAKVLLVGDSGAGKTGLSKRLVFDTWQPSDSTVGAWATQWKLPVASGEEVEREIWLWDFGGQADQRLIHQLYMDETALAVLVFDGQKEDLFETLGQWDRDLTRAARKEFAKLLVAGRVDAGGLRVSRSEVEKFAAERKYRGFLETSAKQDMGCEELRRAILDAIKWDEIPCRTTEVHFKRLKEEIIRLKDEGRVLMRFNELREMLQLRLSHEFKRFTDEELRTVLMLLAGPGVVWELKFGSWVLLQPERINAYAQAVIRTLQNDEHQRGCLMEERVLNGDLAYESSMPRLRGDEERFVLLAMHQTFVERGLCLRQPTGKGNLLVFPSYYRRERPDIVKYPAVLVNYRFTGFLDEIYATLVVRLHHTEPFQQDQLWRYAADFKTNMGKQLGVKLTRRAPGLGELEVYFDPAVAMEEKIIFSKYVHEHLLQHAQEVERLRNYVCPRCGTPVGNREVAMRRLNDWLQNRPPQANVGSGFKFRKGKEEPPSIICVGCEQRVPVWDELEQCFASPEIQQRVRDLQDESAIVLSNQSKERALVGEVISTVALADQICREFNVSDQGIDMEIEFTDDAHEATAAKLYLQLKSGDSYLRGRKGDGAEIFTIKDDRHARYWMAQAFPVLLVIRNAEGEVRWMEIRDWLKRKSGNGNKPVKQIVFTGERFDVMSVRRWREKVLSAAKPGSPRQTK